MMRPTQLVSWCAAAALTAALVLSGAAQAEASDNPAPLPRPGVGVFFTAADSLALRQKIQRPRTFAGMLDPGVPVPFGDGWREVPFDSVKDVAHVRMVVTRYWGIGGGLNEVQVFGP